jgi:hypothetical protein
VLTTMSTAVQFARHGDRYWVSFAFDATAIAVIKALPSHSRRWDPKKRVWHVDAGYAKSLAANLREIGYVVVGLQPDVRAHRETVDGADWARLLFRRVGHMRSEPVFRALSKVLHPDVVGGDTALMRELNDARAELKDNDR